MAGGTGKDDLRDFVNIPRPPRVSRWPRPGGGRPGGGGGPGAERSVIVMRWSSIAATARAHCRFLPSEQPGMFRSHPFGRTARAATLRRRRSQSWPHGTAFLSWLRRNGSWSGRRTAVRSRQRGTAPG